MTRQVDDSPWFDRLADEIVAALDSKPWVVRAEDCTTENQRHVRCIGIDVPGDSFVVYIEHAYRVGGGEGPDPDYGHGPKMEDARSGDVWLTVPEAAALMRLGRNRVYQLCQTGELPHRRVGVSIHVRRDIAETWAPDR